MAIIATDRMPRVVGHDSLEPGKLLMLEPGEEVTWIYPIYCSGVPIMTGLDDAEWLVTPWVAEGLDSAD